MNVISYSELASIAQEEGTISLKDVLYVFKKLVDMDSDDFEEYDYANSTRKKLRDLAQMVINENYKIFADDDDYHNIAVDYARLNLYDCAISILDRGLKHSISSDLLADKILYALESGQCELCEDACTNLFALDKASWGWRAYSFTIKYYLKKVKSLRKGKARNNLKAKTFDLAEEFINYAKSNPEEAADRAYFDKASLVKELGYIGEEGKITQESILADGCKAINPAPQCALSLADIMFDRGQYDNALNYLKQCKLAINNPQPSVNPSYVFLLYAMAKTSKLISETENGDFSNRKSDVDSIYRDLHTSMDSFDINETYRDAAKRTIKMLEIQTGFKDTNQSSNDSEYI